MNSVRFLATTPGGIGNLGPGLDVLGCALAGRRDEVIAAWSSTPGIEVLDAGHPDLPADPLRHASAIAAHAVLTEAQRRGVELRAPGIAISVRKGLPLAGGQGGSAASAIAGASATNALLGEPLDAYALLECGLTAEASVSGRHLDNLAPALLGGIILIRSMDPTDVIRLPVPSGLKIILAHPEQRLSTAQSRRSLPEVIPLAVATHQIAQVSSMVAACYLDDLALFCRAMVDRIAEPARAELIPGFGAAKAAALGAGALASSISGGGPTTFAIADSDERAGAVAEAMHAAYAAMRIACTTTVTEIDPQGTIVRAL